MHLSTEALALAPRYKGLHTRAKWTLRGSDLRPDRCSRGFEEEEEEEEGEGLAQEGFYSRMCSHFKQQSACARSWRRNEAAACANMPACCRRCRRYSVTMRCCVQGCERYSLTTMGAAARRLVAPPPSAAGPSVGATQNGTQPAWQVASLWLDCFPKPSSLLCLCERARSIRALEAWDAA